MTVDVISEEERGLHQRFGGGFGDAGGRPDISDFSALGDEPERFSSDDAWMPRLVLIAKSSHVWLDQLSTWYGREIRSLDAIPDEELDRLARFGVTGLWLIGLWERSRASQRIKQLARQSRRGRLARTRSTTTASPTTWAARTPGRTCASGLGPAASGWRATWCPTTWASTRAGSRDHPEWFLSLDHPPYPGLHVRRPGSRRRRPRGDPPRGPLLGQQRRRGDVRAAGPRDRRTRATSTTATMARASRGTTPRSSTSRAPRSASRSSRPSSPSRAGSPSSASTPRWSWPASTCGGCGSRSRAPAAASHRAPSTGR